ncbi:MAG: hypothetical protein ACKKL4_00160 [Patescibacteria group bacterium]
MTHVSHSSSPDAGDVPIPLGPDGPHIGFFSLASKADKIHQIKRYLRVRVCLGILALGILIAPTLLYTPTSAWAYTTNPQSDGASVTIPEDWDPALRNIILNEVSRHRITGDAWAKRTDTYIDMVAQIESEMNSRAYNQSGAMSYFQFKDESIQTAHNRLINYYRRYDIGAIPRWSVHLYYNPQAIYDVAYNRQAVLMIINIIEQDYERGTDYFRQFLAGDDEAGITAYYRYHHTNPDQFTIRRTQRVYQEYFAHHSQVVAQR